jgi:hypothetical protein
MVGSGVPCSTFWENFEEIYGVGNTPDEALEHLRMKKEGEG